MSWWYYASGTEKALVVVGVIALAILAVVVASPHVKPLQPIANALGLVRTETVYVPIYVNHTVYVNRTVYVNQTVPVYINRTVYVPVYVNTTYAPVGNASLSLIESIAGKCTGDLVILSNNTAWLVLIWLVPKEYVEDNPLLYISLFERAHLVYYNPKTHAAQFFAPPFLYFFGLYPEPASFVAYAGCYINNVTVNGYYTLFCGDTLGSGPDTVMANGFANLVDVNGSYYQVVGLNLISNYPVFVGSQIIRGYWPNATLVIPRVNTTYTGIMLFDEGFTFGSANLYGLVTLGPVCNITVVYAPNPQAALYIKLPWDYAKYFAETVSEVYGSYNPNLVYVGYWVWRNPS